jgi:hypothetical protein
VVVRVETALCPDCCTALSSVGGSEVISPNVCRVFDLQRLDGQELVSME